MENTLEQQNVSKTALNNNDSITVKGNDNKISLTSIIEDNSGGISSSRCLLLLWGGGVFIIWAVGAITALHHGLYTFPIIDSNIITILGIVVGGKTVQRFGEK